METVQAACRGDLSCPFQQPRRDPPGVPKKRSIRGIVDVGFHDGRVGADDAGADRLLRNSIPAQQLVDVLPGLRLDGEEALVQKAEVHHGLLPHAQEVLEERFASCSNDSNGRFFFNSRCSDIGHLRFCDNHR